MSKFSVFAATNCTDPPFLAKGDDRGMSDWNKVSQSYGTKIRYYCPTPGWGFPTSGSFELFNECQADKTWTLDEVEMCVCKWKLLQAKLKLRLTDKNFQCCHVQTLHRQNHRVAGFGMDWKMRDTNVPMGCNLKMEIIHIGTQIAQLPKFGSLKW